MANKDKLIENAQKFLEKGQLPKAIGEYQKIVDAFPKDFRNRQKLAELLSREKRSEEAQPHYEAVARNFTDTGFYLKAIAIYKQMQKLEPARVDIYLRLAELYEKQGQTGNSLNEYRNLVALYEKNHKSREALGILHKMLALEPDNSAVRGKLLEMLVAADEQDEALEQFCALDAMLGSRGDKAGLAKLHAKFAALHGRMAADRSPSAAPPPPAAAGEPGTAAAEPELVAADDSRSAPSEPAAHAELELELDVPSAPVELPLETVAPASPLPATAQVELLPVEIDLELDLDFPSAGEGQAEPPVSVAAAPLDEPSATALPPDSLVLPEFCDLDLEPVPAAEAAAGEPAGPPAAVGLAPPGGEETGAGGAPNDEPAESRGLYDGQAATGEREPDDEPPAFDREDTIEELEELEEFDDAEVAESTGFAAADDGCHDAGVHLDAAGAAGFDGALPESSREDAEEAQSHFDLGIAYKEMGRLNEAIAEFSKAAHQPSRRLDCLTLQGQCHWALGDHKAAEATFKEALGSRGLTDEVRVALRYELGLFYEATGRTLEALESFQFVADRDLFFRDAVNKLRLLRESLGLDDKSADAKGARPGRDRISYV